MPDRSRRASHGNANEPGPAPTRSRGVFRRELHEVTRKGERVPGWAGSLTEEDAASRVCGLDHGARACHRRQPSRHGSVPRITVPSTSLPGSRSQIARPPCSGTNVSSGAASPDLVPNTARRPGGSPAQPGSACTPTPSHPGRRLTRCWWTTSIASSPEVAGRGDRPRPGRNHRALGAPERDRRSRRESPQSGARRRPGLRAPAAPAHAAGRFRGDRPADASLPRPPEATAGPRSVPSKIDRVFGREARRAGVQVCSCSGWRRTFRGSVRLCPGRRRWRPFLPSR